MRQIIFLRLDFWKIRFFHARIETEITVIGKLDKDVMWCIMMYRIRWLRFHVTSYEMKCRYGKNAE